MENIVSYAKYMQNHQRRSKLTKRWPKEYLMDFMFEESKKPSKDSKKIAKNKERSISESPSTIALRRVTRSRRESLFNKMSNTYKQKKTEQAATKSSYQKPRGHAPFNYKQKLTMDTDFDVGTSNYFCNNSLHILHINLYIYICFNRNGRLNLEIYFHYFVINL